jgi:hypothetical protein
MKELVFARNVLVLATFGSAMKGNDYDVAERIPLSSLTMAWCLAVRLLMLTQLLLGAKAARPYFDIPFSFESYGISFGQLSRMVKMPASSNVFMVDFFFPHRQNRRHDYLPGSSHQTLR